MFNQNPRSRLSKRRTVTLMIALTILAWATQTLFHQWGFGAELSGAPNEEKFISPNPSARGAALEVRAEASIVGAEVRLKQVCRWSDADNATIAPMADLVLLRLAQKQPFRSISVDEIKTTLREAGVSVASINFTGAASCTISRADVKYDERVALQQWIDARAGKKIPVESPTTQLAAVASIEQPPIQMALKSDPGASKPGVRTLRDLLILDLAQRLNLGPEVLQVDFRPEDQRILNLSDAQFKFALEAQRVRNLGSVEWAVTIITDEGNQKVKISAGARAWQDQLVLAKPLAHRQIIQPTDLVDRRMLVDTLSDEPIATRSQVVGQQAARELKSGTVLSSRMIDPIELVKTGQYVTISIAQGGVKVKTVARALEAGSFGQTIKVKNETTKDMFDVTITGPQTATLNSPVPSKEGALTSGQ